MVSTSLSSQSETFFTNTEQIEDVRRDITPLDQVDLTNDNKKFGKRLSSRPKLDLIQPWAHLSFMLIAGDQRDCFGNQLVAVTGKVGNNAITAALVTCDVSYSHDSGQLSVSELTPVATAGRKLLSDLCPVAVCATFYVFAPSLL